MATKQDTESVHFFNLEVEDFSSKSTKELKRQLGIFSLVLDDGFHRSDIFRQVGVITYLLELRGHDPREATLPHGRKAIKAEKTRRAHYRGKAA